MLSRPSALRLALQVLLSTVLAALGLVPAIAQLPTTMSTPSPLSGPVRASDGNYYAASYVPNLDTGNYTCQGSQAVDPCGAIYRITPAGVATKLFDFSTVANHADGILPNPLVIGPDGALYGTTLGGGPMCQYTSCGVFYRLGLDGTFSLLHAFITADFGGTYSSQGDLFGRLVLGSDGNFYTVTRNTGVIFRLTPTGQVTALYNFESNNTGNYTYTNGATPTGLVEGDDGNFYGTAGSGPQPYSGYGVPVGEIFRMTPAGAVSVLASFPQNTPNAKGYPNDPDGKTPFGPLVEGPGSVFYGITQGDPSQAATPGQEQTPTLFSYSSAAGIHVLHTFAADDTEGYDALGGVLLGSDGNLYGTAQYGGSSVMVTPYTITGYGTFFSVTPGGAFTLLRQFTKSTTDGAYPSSPLLQDIDGSIVGAASSTNLNTAYPGSSSPVNGVLFDYNAGAAAPVQLTFTDPSSGTVVASTGVNATVKLNWQVLAAFSNTARQCYAAIRGGGAGAGAGVWTGKQTGSPSATGYAGSAMITPTAAGTYVYALTCGGVQSGFATLVVGGTDQITTTSLPGGTVSQPYTAQLTATGGKAPYTWTAASSTFSNIVRSDSDPIHPRPLGGPVSGLPEGLTLNATTGLISGTPTQFGTGTVQLVALDSSKPANKATASLPIAVVAGLAITTPSLKKGTVGGNYKQQLTATGGLPPYTWSVTAGPLPDGLTLNASTGLITGAPTTAATTMLTLQVADSERMPATLTGSFTLKVEPKIAVAALEMTQVIQQYQLIDDFDATVTASGGEPPVPLVVGKPTVARFYLTAVKDATTVTLKVDGVQSESKTLKATPNCQPEDARAHTNNCPSIDFYFTPTTPSFQFVYELDDDQGNMLDQNGFGMSARTMASVIFRGVNFCTTGNVSACTSGTDLIGITEMTQALWPTAAVAPAEAAITLRQRVDAVPTNDQLLALEETLKDRVNALYSPADKAADAKNDTDTSYVAFYPSVLGNVGAVAALPGYGIALAQTADAPDHYLSHEFGHNLNAHHTNTPQPLVSPYLPPGCFANAPDPVTTYPFANNDLQSSQGVEYGFDVARQRLVNPTANFDLMSYCDPLWSGPYNYKQGFFELHSPAVNSPTVKGPGATPESGAHHPLGGPVLVSGSFLQISGSIGTAGLSLQPIFQQTTQGTTDAGTGTYSMEELDASGNVLFTRFFAPTAYQSDSFTATPAPASASAFAEWIPATSGTASISILDPTGVVLKSVAVPSTSPAVTITSPVAGFVGSGQQTVSWTVQDPNATTFESRVFYSVDGGTTFTEIEETDQTTDTVDFSTVPGAASAILRVDVSDGVRTGSATSVAFPVPRKLPTKIVIDTPLAGSLFQAANPVYLSGEAYDADDGMLSGNALQWSDSVQGALGSGSPLSVNLKPGAHTLTLTGTDSDGNSLTATTSITLAGAAPSVTLTSTATMGACNNAIINAQPGAQGASLTQVQYSLDGGATYTQIALGALPFTLALPGSGAINLVVVALDGSGQTTAQSAELTLSGSCGSNTLSVSSGSGQTAAVNAAFAAPLVVKVVDSKGNGVAGIVVTFSAPTSGAGAVLSASSAVTAAGGTASVIAAANGTGGAYSITAGAPNTSPVNFSLANTDFQVAAANSALTVARGSSSTDTITVTSLGGFAGTVTFGCSGLPAGVSCAFSPSTATLQGSTTTSTLTVSASPTAAWHLENRSGVFLACCIGFVAFLRRKRLPGLCLTLLLAASLFAISGCGEAGNNGKLGPATSTITVTVTSGSLQHTSSLSVTVQ